MSSRERGVRDIKPSTFEEQRKGRAKKDKKNENCRPRKIWLRGRAKVVLGGGGGGRISVASSSADVTSVNEKNIDCHVDDTCDIAV
jgi:hypothetical protein